MLGAWRSNFAASGDRCLPEPDLGSSADGTCWWVPSSVRARHHRAMTASSAVRRAITLLALVVLFAALPLSVAAVAAKDTDHDLLPDSFETDKSHTNPRRADTDRDGLTDDRENPDHDALMNRWEYLAGTNPRKGDTDRDGIGDGKEDPDHDGLTNKLEQTLKIHPRRADTDGDGYRDGTEYRAHTNPKDAASHPVPPTNPNGSPTVAGAPGCGIFPVDNVWNMRIDDRDVASNSATMISSIGLTRGLHMDFGSYAGYGIPINIVGNGTTPSTVTFDYSDESDHVSYPIPSSPKVEGGSDRHILMLDKDLCRLYELFNARKVSGVWRAGSGAMWDLTSNALRPAGWTPINRKKPRTRRKNPQKSASESNRWFPFCRRRPGKTSPKKAGDRRKPTFDPAIVAIVVRPVTTDPVGERIRVLR